MIRRNLVVLLSCNFVFFFFPLSWICSWPRNLPPHPHSCLQSVMDLCHLWITREIWHFLLCPFVFFSILGFDNLLHSYPVFFFESSQILSMSAGMAYIWLGVSVCNTGVYIWAIHSQASQNFHPTGYNLSQPKVDTYVLSHESYPKLHWLR